jgi:hypothetical protein
MINEIYFLDNFFLDKIKKKDYDQLKILKQILFSTNSKIRISLNLTTLNAIVHMYYYEINKLISFVSTLLLKDFSIA